MAHCIIPRKEVNACAMTATFFHAQKQVQSCEMSSKYYCCKSGKQTLHWLGVTAAVFLSFFYHTPTVLDHRHLHANLST